MKPLKAAAVVAGSVAMASAAGPAIASDLTTSLNGPLERISSRQLLDEQPLHTDVIDTKNEGSALNTVQGARDSLNQASAGQLLGGLPLQN